MADIIDFQTRLKTAGASPEAEPALPEDPDEGMRRVDMLEVLRVLILSIDRDSDVPNKPLALKCFDAIWEEFYSQYEGTGPVFVQVPDDVAMAIKELRRGDFAQWLDDGT